MSSEIWHRELNETKSGTTHMILLPYLGAIQDRSKACHKEVIKSKHGVVKRPSAG